MLVAIFDRPKPTEVKSKKYTEKRQFIKDEKRREKKHSPIIIGLILFGVGYYYFIEPKTIGHDIRYSIYIFWLPTILGLVTLAIYRRQFLINKFSTNKGFVLWAFMIFFYLFQGFVISYFSLGQVAKISWDILNERATKQSQIETLRCNVTKFSKGTSTRGSRSSIDFTFKDRPERIFVDNATIKEYIDENPKKYEILVEGQQGIWSYYKVTSWTLTKK
jgi:hypothetical protein